MTRRMRLVLCVGLVPVGVAIVAGTSWGGGRPVREGDVLSIRTAGQPERQVRVIAAATDAEGYTDVVDLGTGARYSLPARMVARLNPVPPGEVRHVKPPPGRPAISHALSAVPSFAPARPTPPVSVASSRFPTTRTQTGDRVQPPARPPGSMVRGLLRLDPPPLALAEGVGPRPTPDLRPATPPVVPRPAPVEVAAEPPVRPNPLPSEPPVQPNPVVASAPTPPVNPAAMSPLPSLLAAGLPPTQPSYSTVALPPDIAKVTPPESVALVAPMAEGLPPTQPSYSTVALPPGVGAAPVPVSPLPVVHVPEAPRPRVAISVERAMPRPSVVIARAAAPAAGEGLTASSFAMLPTPPARRAALGGGFVEVLPEPVAAPPVQSAVAQVAHSRLPPDPVGLSRAGRLAPVADQMAEEIRPFVEELTNALRPSLRARAAGALADGRYGSRPEVKALLAQAALIDPASEVRAHCINRLSRLGYQESTYLAYLDACAYSGQESVKAAAVEALGRLTNRNR